MGCPAHGRTPTRLHVPEVNRSKAGRSRSRPRPARSTTSRPLRRGPGRRRSQPTRSSAGLFQQSTSSFRVSNSCNCCCSAAIRSRRRRLWRRDPLRRVTRGLHDRDRHYGRRLHDRNGGRRNGGAQERARNYPGTLRGFRHIGAVRRRRSASVEGPHVCAGHRGSTRCISQREDQQDDEKSRKPPHGSELFRPQTRGNDRISERAAATGDQAGL